MADTRKVIPLRFPGKEQEPAEHEGRPWVKLIRFFERERRLHDGEPVLRLDPPSLPPAA